MGTCALHGQCQAQRSLLHWLPPLIHIGFVFFFASLLSLSPTTNASRSACPVTAHITPDVEKVSSYFCTPASFSSRSPPSPPAPLYVPLSAPLFSDRPLPPKSSSSSSSSPSPLRGRIPDRACTSANPLAHRVPPPLPHTPSLFSTSLPSLLPPLFLFPSVACRMPHPPALP